MSYTSKVDTRNSLYVRSLVSQVSEIKSQIEMLDLLFKQTIEYDQALFASDELITTLNILAGSVNDIEYEYAEAFESQKIGDTPVSKY